MKTDMDYIAEQCEAIDKANGREPMTDITPDFGWYCWTCGRAVQNEHVTFQEIHDPRCGGCGNHVEPYDRKVTQ